MRRQQNSLASLLLAVLLVSATAAVPMSAAAADSSGNDPIDDWMATVDEENDGEDDGILSRITSYAPEASIDVLAAVDGQADRVLSNPFRDVPTNQDTANEFEKVVEQNSDTYEEKINEEANLTTGYDTHAIIIGHEDSDSVGVFLVGDVNDGNISNIRVLNESEFNETGRETDELWVVDGDAAENLPELADTIAERISNGDSVGESYQRRLGGRYCSFQSPFSKSIVSLEECDVRSTIWLEEQAVLEGGDD